MLRRIAGAVIPAALLAHAWTITPVSIDHYEADRHNKFRGNPKAFETIRMQLSNILWHLRLMLAAL